MITKASLRHPTLRVRLDLAMKAATFESYRDGWIGSSHASGITVIHTRNRIPSGFYFYSAGGSEITQTVLQALRESKP